MRTNFFSVPLWSSESDGIVAHLATATIKKDKDINVGFEVPMSMQQQSKVKHWVPQAHINVVVVKISAQTKLGNEGLMKEKEYKR